jgi:predicted histone-like DNA-binding protein
MAVKFKEAGRINPSAPGLPLKYYAMVKAGDKVKFEELAELISKVSNLNYGEIFGSLATFLEIIEMQLRHGREVELNTLGTFFLTLNSEGVDTRGELSAEHIKGARIRFRPGKRLKKMSRNLDFEKEN